MVMPLTTRRFTVDEYHRMGRAGVFHEGDRVELLEGQIVEMSPIGDRHASCVRRLNRLFARSVLDLAVIDVQNPVVLDEHNAPQPDLALLKLSADGYPTHPRAPDVLLIIEVADTSVPYDRDVKVPLYAAAGIPEVWLINLTDDAVMLYRDLVGGRYATVRTARRGETVASLRVPSAPLRVEDVLG